VRSSIQRSISSSWSFGTEFFAGSKSLRLPRAKRKGVADFAIGFAELGHDTLGHFYVGLVFDTGDPEAQKIGAPFFADFVRLNRVTERFGHRTALFIERPAVRDDAFVRRPIFYADGDEK